MTESLVEKGFVQRPTRAAHFKSLDQQKQAATLGMWVFLATEVLFFGGLFTGYSVYRDSYPEAFRQASAHLYLWIGSVNTAILLLSSTTMAFAVAAAAADKRRQLVGLLLTTASLGVVFLCFKGYEYFLDYKDGIVPGISYTHHHFPDATTDQHAQLFFVFYLLMTALHALHVTIGVCVITGTAIRAWFGAYSADNHNTVENVALYWHFVDVVWIFLLPLLYLYGASGAH